MKDNNGILIGNSLLISCSLLLEKKVRLDEASFLDFCSLLNALTFHHKVITFPAHLPYEISNSRLYKYLVENGILQQEEFSLEGPTKDDFYEFVELAGGVDNQGFQNLDIMLDLDDIFWTTRSDGL